jgi:hypothetical protein
MRTHFYEVQQPRVETAFSTSDRDYPLCCPNNMLFLKLILYPYFKEQALSVLHEKLSKSQIIYNFGLYLLISVYLNTSIKSTVNFATQLHQILQSFYETVWEKVVGINLANRQSLCFH